MHPQVASATQRRAILHHRRAAVGHRDDVVKLHFGIAPAPQGPWRFDSSQAHSSKEALGPKAAVVRLRAGFDAIASVHDVASAKPLKTS